VVADTLWPDADGDTAANRLHHTLHVTRRTIDPSAPRRAGGRVGGRGRVRARGRDRAAW
jgi:hypothetical protein